MAGASYSLSIPVDQAVAILDAIRELTSPEQVEFLSEHPLAEALARLEELHTLALDALEHVRLTTDGIGTGDEVDDRPGCRRRSAGRGADAREPEAHVHGERQEHDLDRVPGVPARHDRGPRQADHGTHTVHHSQSVEVAVEPTRILTARPSQDPLGGLMDEQHWLD